MAPGKPVDSARGTQPKSMRWPHMADRGRLARIGIRRTIVETDVDGLVNNWAEAERGEGARP
eukprot:10056996-Lingulodinium_polyedra.AAC.1